MAMVYAEWASHGDDGPYHGWVVAWNVTNLSTQGMVLSGVLCTDPNGGEGGIWGGGGGLTFDPDETFNGQPAFYFETGNGDPRGGPPPLDANGFPTDDDYYESLVKVEADPTTTATNQNSNGWGLKIVDYFTPYNVNALDDADEDFGSGSPLVLPDSAGIPGHPHLIVAAGKEGTIYLLDRDNLGKFNVNDDNVLNSVYNPSTGITTPPVLINGSLSTPAYYHGTLYWVAGYNSNAWSYVVAPNPAPDPPTVPVATLEPTSETANNNFGYLPGSVMISADGSEDPAGGIVWIMDTQQRRTPCLQHPVAQHRIVEQRTGQHRRRSSSRCRPWPTGRFSSARRTACRSSGSPERIRRPRRPTLRPTSAPRRYRVRPSN